jgi:hypothetical protein
VCSEMIREVQTTDTFLHVTPFRLGPPASSYLTAASRLKCTELCSFTLHFASHFFFCHGVYFPGGVARRCDLRFLEDFDVMLELYQADEAG